MTRLDRPDERRLLKPLSESVSGTNDALVHHW
jgi:hypothetical protein